MSTKLNGNTCNVYNISYYYIPVNNGITYMQQAMRGVSQQVMQRGITCQETLFLPYLRHSIGIGKKAIQSVRQSVAIRFYQYFEVFPLVSSYQNTTSFCMFACSSHELYFILDQESQIWVYMLLVYMPNCTQHPHSDPPSGKTWLRHDQQPDTLGRFVQFEL
jgi:hypothetical protein